MEPATVFRDWPCDDLPLVAEIAAGGAATDPLSAAIAYASHATNRGARYSLFINLRDGTRVYANTLVPGPGWFCVVDGEVIDPGVVAEEADEITDPRFYAAGAVIGVEVIW